MRRTPLRRKSPLGRGKGLGRGKALRKASKAPISRIQRELWELCKQITRLRHGNVCYTCGAAGLAGSDWQTGHMWPKASLGASLKYDLRILRPQCSICNRWRDGEGAVYYARMARDMGAEWMAALEADKVEDKKGRVNAYDHYVRLIGEYKVILAEIQANKRNE